MGAQVTANGYTINVNDATAQLFNNLNDYTNGLAKNILTVQAGGKLDANSAQILASVSKSIPGAAEAQQIAGVITNLVDTTLGSGSTAGRVLGALQGSNVLTAPFNAMQALFSGRTYGYDQYQLAVAYWSHVVGKNVGDTNHASDADVLQACKWFIDKLGVYIDGADTLTALLHGPQAYMALVRTHPYVTLDPVRVQAACEVRQQYMPDDSTTPGNWRNAQGVYDSILVNMVNKGYADTQQDLQIIRQQQSQGSTDITPVNYLTQNPILLILVIVIVILLLIKILK